MKNSKQEQNDILVFSLFKIKRRLFSSLHPNERLILNLSDRFLESRKNDFRSFRSNAKTAWKSLLLYMHYHRESSFLQIELSIQFVNSKLEDDDCK